MLRLNKFLPQFRFNEAAQRFVAANGQFVARETVKGASEAVAQQAIRDFETAAVQFNADGDLDAFMARMALNQRRATIANTLVAAGGPDQMTRGKWIRAGDELRKQAEFREGFRQRISAGEMSPAQIVANAKQYGGAPRVYYEYAQAQNHFDELGHTKVRNRYGGNEHHCEGPGSCKAMNLLGLVDPSHPEWRWPGDRLCHGNDHCGVETE